MLSWRVLFPNKPESGNLKRPFLWVLQLKLIGHTLVFPMRSLPNTKVNLFHYIYQPTTSKYWSLPMSKKEYRMSAFERWSLMLYLNYKITAHSLYKVWEMPKYEKETGVIYDSIILPRSLLNTRCICFHSILGLYATLFIKY